MTWVRIDDRFPHHRKGIAAGPLGRDLFVCGLAYSNLHRTSGNIPETSLRNLAPGHRRPRETAERLVEIGLWERTATGWLIHDYGDWNKSAEEIDAIIEQKRASGRIGGQRSGEARRKQRATPSASGSTEAESKHDAVVLPNPSPLRSKDLRSREADASTNGHTPPRFTWPEGADRTTTHWTPNDRRPYEAFHHDCPDRAWRGIGCVSRAYVAQHPDALATLPCAPGPDQQSVPKQCPVHRAQPLTPTRDEVTPAW